MEIYDYKKNIFKDVLEALKEEYSQEEIAEKLNKDKYDFEIELEDKFWTYDNVTGNSSGSYTFCTATARKFLYGNEDLLIEALEYFGNTNIKLIKNPELLDVTIRCYLLRGAICEALDHLEEKICTTK